MKNHRVTSFKAPKGEPPQKPSIGQEILSYLSEHPDAQDTLEGITQWWLLQKKIISHAGNIQDALSDLVRQGKVIVNQNSGRTVYKLNLKYDAESRATQPRFRYPGVYVQETGSTPHDIEGVKTSVVAFMGMAAHGQIGAAVSLTSFAEFQNHFGNTPQPGSFLSDAVSGFFQNGGSECLVLRLPDSPKDEDIINNLKSLEQVELNILCAPGFTSTYVQQAILDHCERLRDRVCILDSASRATASSVAAQRAQLTSPHGFGALYYPWIVVQGKPVPPSGHVAGLFCRTDRERGVYKSPAGIALSGVSGIEQPVTDAVNESLSLSNINCIRQFPGKGIVLWGARTLSSDPEWKYVNIRRYLCYLEKSVHKGLAWVVFEPNAEALWMNVRRAVEDLLMREWRLGALVGKTPNDAFFVKCDRTTITQSDMNDGRLICLVGVAVVRPAEYIIFRSVQTTAA